jgi:hypothetical protein
MPYWIFNNLSSSKSNIGGMGGRFDALPKRLIPNQDVPQGTMCGSYDSANGLALTCGGLNPAVSCPTGYYRNYIFGAEGHGFVSCVKS